MKRREKSIRHEVIGCLFLSQNLCARIDDNESEQVKEFLFVETTISTVTLMVNSSVERMEIAGCKEQRIKLVWFIETTQPTKESDFEASA